MNIIYLVISTDGYETYTVVKAFESKMDAIEFAKKCTAYERTRYDELMDFSAWIDTHPAGKNYDHYYRVEETTLVRAK